MDNVTQPLGEILREVGAGKGHSYQGLFFPEGEELSPEVHCLVTEIDEFDLDASIDRIEALTVFRFVLDMDRIRDIVANAYSQNPGASEEQLVEALAYYYENDAFIEMKNAE